MAALRLQTCERAAESGNRSSVLMRFLSWIDPNLTVLTHALVTQLTFESKKATGVEILWNGKTH
jgi:choline dehydrogenase